MEIIHDPHPILRKKALPVPKSKITSAEIKKLIREMQRLMKTEKNGVAIAAPQVGESLRIFVIAGYVYAIRAQEVFDATKHHDRVFINPEIISVSKKKREMHEGCLSVRGENTKKLLWGDVPRAEKIKIRFLDEVGAPQTVGASGFLAQIFQHEIDHLNGVLYPDTAVRMYEDSHDHEH